MTTKSPRPITAELPFRPPYDWDAMIGFLAARAIPSVEVVRDGEYRRTFSVGNASGVLAVAPDMKRNRLIANIYTRGSATVTPIASKLRRLFDLDTDMAVVDAHLARDKRLRRLVQARPGMRVPGAWDGFELAVRAVLGQQISVSAARTFAGRIAHALGKPLRGARGERDEPTRLFPTPHEMAKADLTGIGLTRARTTTLIGLARAMRPANRVLDPSAPPEETVKTLESLPGIGPWTAQYIAMRALKAADAFPSSDLGLLRACESEGKRPTPAEIEQIAQSWRPWRAYAVIRLWLQT